MVVEVKANIEVDLEKIARELWFEKRIELRDITMDDVLGYVQDNVRALSGRNPGVKQAEDGPSVNCFVERDYERLCDQLEAMIAKEGGIDDE